MINRSKNISSSILSLGIVFILSYFSIVHEFWGAPITMWDEATYANNSIDMAFGYNNWLVVSHLNNPDLYNTKPPFVIWMQAISIKIFGINEFAVRFPTIFSSLLTVFIVYFFSVRNLGTKIYGLMAATVLVASKGYVLEHVARTGDLDGILVFCLTLGLLTFLDFIIRKPSKRLFHYSLLSLSLFLGFLSKGVAGFFFVPFYLIIAFLPWNIWVLKDLKIYSFALITLALCSSYYLLRESLNPGYLEIVLGSEIMRINSTVMSWHVHPFDFYYQNLKSGHYDAFFYFLLLSLVAPFILRGDKVKIAVYLLIVSGGYFLLISFPDVKLAWYDAPLFPIFSILLSLGFVGILTFLREKFFSNLNRQAFSLILVCLIGFIVYQPLNEIIRANSPDEKGIYSKDFDGAYLRYLNDSDIDISNLIVLKYEEKLEHYDQVLFYLRAYNIEENLNLTIRHNTDSLEGKLLMCSQEDLKEKLVQEYFVDIIDTWKHGYLYQVGEKKVLSGDFE